MIWIALAAAATPEELVAKLPEARSTLESCAVEGCQRGKGARAAWLVAVGTYTESGVADGAVAATVRELDEGLFATLPDVVQEAATEPLPWSTRVGGMAEPEPAPVEDADPHVQHALDSLPGDLEAPPRRPASLTIRVVDTNGEVIPAASIRFVGEDDLHRVHTETGLWTGVVLYLRDGTERTFQKGEVFTFVVSAPGFAPSRVSYVLSGKRKNLVSIQLKPKTFTVGADANWAEKAAVDSWAQWSEAEHDFVAMPTSESEKAAWKTRTETARLAREWMDLGGGDEALELCLLTGTLQLCGAGD